MHGAGDRLYHARARRSPGYRALGFLATAPVAIPGIVLGVGLFLSYTRPPFVLYGTLWILLIAFVTIALPAAYQQLQSAFRSVHTDLEDASRILGATRLRTLRDITAPLLRTSVIATWCFIFVGVIRELSAAIMLFTSETKVISVLIFDLNEMRRPRRHLGARPDHAGHHLRRRRRGQPHPRLRRRCACAILTLNRVADGRRETSRRSAGRRNPGGARSRRSIRRGCPPPCAASARICCRRGRALSSPRATRTTSRRRWRAGTRTGPAPRSAMRAPMSAAGAAFVNGTAAHGEDFDDTFEGGPVHAGAVIVPAVLAACERYNPDGPSALLGIAVGIEVMCRLSMVAPKAVHKAGFHPTAVFGAMGAAAGVGAALRLDAAPDGRCARHRRLDGARHHRISRRGHLDQAACMPGWAAQSGLRAALLARAGFLRAAHRVRRRARAVSRLRPHHQGQLRRADRRFRRALGDADARVQALSLRDHDASLHRLRAAAGDARDQGGGDQSRWCARSARARCIGCGSRSRPSSAPPTAMPANSPRRIASPLASCAASRARCLHRRRGAGACRARACREGALPDRSRKILIPTISPATSARRLPTAAWSRSASRICAAARTSRCSRGDIEEKFVLNARHGGWDAARTERALALLRTLV